MEKNPGSHEGQIPKDQLRDDILRVALDEARKGQKERAEEVLQEQRSPTFDKEQYELLKNAEVVELGIEDLPLIAKLYKKFELSEEAFYELMQGELEEFGQYLAKGCFADRWETTSEQELATLLRHCPQYKQSGEEFAEFFNEDEVARQRGSEFKILGMKHPETGELLAMACAFLPPRNSGERMNKHSSYIEGLLDGNPNYTPSQKSQGHKLILDEPEKTAEFYLIAAERGFGVPMFNHLLQNVLSSSYDIKQWLLFRLGGMKLVEPFDQLIQQESWENINTASLRLFKRLGFCNCGEYANPNTFAAREVRGKVVLCRVYWDMMHGTHDKVVSHTNTEMQHLAQKAREADCV